MSSSPAPAFPATTPSASTRALASFADRPGASLWRAGALAQPPTATSSTGWPALDAELPGGGWPSSGLTDLLTEPAGGELALLAPWLQTLGQRREAARELVWINPPGRPCLSALQALALDWPHLVCVTPATPADAAWTAEQAVRAGSCAAVLWWSERPVARPTLRRLHLAAQAGTTPLMAMQAPAARALSSPAPLRLACLPLPDRVLAVDVFKRRGPPMPHPLQLELPWPASAHRLPAPERNCDAVDRPAPAPAAAASPALVAARA
ncbi:translesion DNA synthesis-associated protein ImuA [Methylibium sp.]|uniref:translesion DNA synthesis-associated protein ImuA n=1 Tax=Methylibium sp. TaxID=2067992 RepID=UPI003D0CD94D